MQPKEQVRRSMRSGKKSYCTAFDLYVGQYSKQHLTISSNVSWKFRNKKFDNPLTIQRMILKKSKLKHFYNYLDNTGLMFSTKTFYKLLSEDATKIGITIILFFFLWKTIAIHLNWNAVAFPLKIVHQLYKNILHIWLRSPPLT